MQMFNSFWQYLEKYSLAICIVILSFLFLAFYPTRTVNVDEISYLSNAHLILENRWINNCDLAESAGQFHIGDQCVSKYNIGTSVFLIPAALFGDQFAFLITFVVFILGIITFGKILQELGLSPNLIWLYAIFPAFIYFSRTLLSETYSATFILLAAFGLLKYLNSSKWRWAILAGSTAGIAILVRNTNIIPLILLFGGTLLQNHHSSIKVLIQKSAPLVISILPWVVLLLLINWLSYGNPLQTGYSLSGEQGIYEFAQVPLFLIRFILFLSLIYPGMILAPFFTHSKLSIGTVLAVAGTVIFYSGFPSTVFEGRLLDLILGVRFLIPIIPLLLISYALLLNSYLAKRKLQVLFSIGIVGFVVLAVLINLVHQIFLTLI